MPTSQAVHFDEPVLVQTAVQAVKYHVESVVKYRNITPVEEVVEIELIPFKKESAETRINSVPFVCEHHWKLEHL